MMPDSSKFMSEAIELAARGRGRVEPNPMVGCVLVKAGRIVGRGWHRQYGGPHAEVEALADAGVANADGADVYVTLEPCAHWGKTPPCTDALIRANVKRVFAAIPDPFPQTRGIGPQRLLDAGIPIEFGMLAHQAAELNAPYLKLVTHGVSYVIAKWAMTEDGRMSLAGGGQHHGEDGGVMGWCGDGVTGRRQDEQSTPSIPSIPSISHTAGAPPSAPRRPWISCEESRRLVHQMRNEVDVIMVGIGTVLADDPELTCRIPGGRHPRRLIVDSSARIPLDSRIIRTARDVPTIIATTAAAPADRLKALDAAGCTIMILPAEQEYGGREDRRTGRLDDWTTGRGKDRRKNKTTKYG